MAKGKGQLFLLQVESATAGTYLTVAGLRGTTLSGKQQAVDVTSKDSPGFRELLEGAGFMQFTASGSGVFDSGTAHERVLTVFMGKQIKNWQVIRASGDKFTGPMLVTELEYAGNHDGEETYSLTLESAGVIAFTEAP